MLAASPLLILSVIAVVVAVHTDDPRPNLTEWQQERQLEATAESESRSRDQKMAAVDKALEMLQGVRTKVLEEGEAEAATYDKFACFCKDNTAERQSSIMKGYTDRSTLMGQIDGLVSKRSSLDTQINNAIGAIDTLEDNMRQEKQTRKETKAIYQKNIMDLIAALDALAGAIRTLKTSKSPSLVQLQGVSNTIRTAALLADALGLGDKAASALLQQDPVPANEVPMENYKFHSDDIITTLEQLNTDFKKKKIDIDEDEVASIHGHNMAMQSLTHSRLMKKQELDQARQDKSKTGAEISDANQRLSTVEATLREDEQYLDKLSHMCSDKAKTWDDRSQVRSDELHTLSQAIEIIRSAVKGNISAKTVRFAQQGASVRMAKFVVADEVSMDAIEAEAEQADAASSFAQTGLARRGRLRATVKNHPPNPTESVQERDAVISLLNGEGGRLKSTLLTSLANKIAADPFAKVKQLIEELIERLLQQASAEANHKGWCDKAISDSKQKRDYAAQEVRRLNTDMIRLEAERDDLAEQILVLMREIDKVTDALTEANQQRAQESQQNADTVQEAKDGLSALDQCITLLDRFYKTQSKNSLQYNSTDTEDAPSLQFGTGEAYKGAQQDMVGIIGMLTVMKSDFTRTVQETEVAEEQAQQDHLQFVTESNKTLAQKEEAKDSSSTQKQAVVSELGTATDDLDSHNTELEGAIQELRNLKPVCIDTGMTYSDRVGRREDEIASLNKALCILGKYETYGPGGAEAC